MRLFFSLRFVRLGAFAIFAIIGEMIRRSRLGLEPRHSLIVIDELATIARLSAYAEILTLVRKHNVSLLMANQSTSQLEATDMNLANIIRENSMTRVYLTPIADDEASLQLESKDVVRNRASRTSSGFFSESTTERDEVEPVLTRNEIKEVSATAFHGFAIFDDGTGHQDQFHSRLNRRHSPTTSRSLENLSLAERCRRCRLQSDSRILSEFRRCAR